MNVKFLNPFLDAAHQVLQAEVDLHVIRGNLRLESSAMTADEVTVLINLVGQVEGVVLYGMSIQTCVALVSRVMGQDFTEFDDLARSGVAEMGNVITGRATVMMAETGYESIISPPTLIEGKNIKISTLDFSRVVVPLNTPIGAITVHLALRESNKDIKNLMVAPVALPGQHH